ncbi:hypothetical protein PseudUWO310_19785 [Pseudanabaena sp. UWO310]|nr:hypothetical protein PseudUWO310_19785 [Pseudanabaena sp. UWO310]
MKPQELTGGAKRRQSILGVYVLVHLAIAIIMPSYLYQFPKVWLHFGELKNKPSKGFKITKWRSHFVIWYY